MAACCLWVLSAGAAPTISEFMAANDGRLVDEDGDTPDWIELYNPGPGDVQLTGWYLTDQEDDLSGWAFPELTLPEGDYLVVFASGKDRSDPAAPLHTDFKLKSEGEYLALVQPDATTVVSEFAPVFPYQYADGSYGLVPRTTNLVGAADTGKYFLPNSSDTGTTWTTPGYNDASWTPGAQGYGYPLLGQGFVVTVYQAVSDIANLSAAEDIVANPALYSAVYQENVPTINYLNTGAVGNFAGDRTYPGYQIGQNADRLAMVVEGSIFIPSAGDWTFGVNSDDGFGLDLTGSVDSFHLEFPDPRGPYDTLGVFTVTTPGYFQVRLIYYENGGGAAVEFFAAPGNHGSFNGSVFRLVGDEEGGGLGNTGFGLFIQTDLQAEMSGQHEGCWVRLPFTHDAGQALQGLFLHTRFDDGVAAYLNGVEQFVTNAPAVRAGNSVALSDRDDALADRPVSLNLTGAISTLQPGANVLALHGLNSSRINENFLLQAELIGDLGYTGSQGYLAPTPGTVNEPAANPQLAPLVCSTDHAITNQPLVVTFTHLDPGVDIRYTLDGSVPEADTGLAYTGALHVASTTVLRARGFEEGWRPTPTVTRSYLFMADVLQQSPNGEVPGPGWPTGSVNGQIIDYGMDPDIVNHASYQADMLAAMTAIPSISLVTDLDHLFDASTGIYVNPGQDGYAWERPTSAELIHPDGSEGFQIDAGLRIRGGYSRSTNNPKHALRLFFRDSYGAAKLNYPLFGDEGVDRFDHVDLRTAQNYSWSFGGDSRNTFIREVINRDVQAEQGRLYTRSRYYHLFLNGHYWGLFMSEERPEADYSASYLGGNEEDYDVVKVEAGPYTIGATDGNLNAWSNVWTEAVAGFDDTARYYRTQGLHPDGSPNPAYPRLIDIDSLIDMMLGVYYSGDLDSPISNFLGNNRPNNAYCLINREEPDGFKFVRHDGEHTFLDNNRDRTGPWSGGSEFRYFNGQWLHQQLTAHADYRMRFADAVYRDFFHDGVFTETAVADRIQRRMSEIEFAILGESARWGDSKRDIPFNKGDWLAAVNWILYTHLPVRTGITVQQFRDRGWYPAVEPPQFNQRGGSVPFGFGLAFTGGAGSRYYTLDGSDPRLPGGGLSPTAVLYTGGGQVTSNALVSLGSTWRYRDTGVDLGTGWRHPGYADGSWPEGPAQLGYGDGGEATEVSFGGDSNNKHPTTYFRRTFAVPAGLAPQELKLYLVRDDGAAVYINGTEVLRSNLPAVQTIEYATYASGVVGGSDESTPFEFDIDPATLIPGAENTIAVEIHQVSGSSSDISFDLGLSAVNYEPSNPVALTHSGLVRTRSFSGGAWSALNEVFFAIGMATEDLRIAEMMVHPPAPSDGNPFSDEDFEFVELWNVGTEPLDLARVGFDDGIQASFSNLMLQAGDRAVAVRNLEAFSSRYDTNGMQVAGTYTGAMNNGGDDLRLHDPFGRTVQQFSYTNWYPVADGGGYSMIATDGEPPAPASTSNAWAVGTIRLGTPGWPEPDLAEGAVVVNEALTHTDASIDWIELHNTTTNDLPLAGWLLSDDPTQLAKFAFTNGTVIPPRGYLLLRADTQFGNPAHPGSIEPFALSELGDEVCLASGSGGIPTGWRTEQDFGAADREVPFGRHLRSDGGVDFVAMSQATPAASNALPLVGPVVLHELMYHPLTNGLEFVELRNISGSALPLFDPSVPTNTWRLSGGVDYTMPAGITLPPDGYLVLTETDPALFRTRFGVPASVPVLGPYDGKMDNDTDSVKLRRPGDPEPDGTVPMILVDRVKYTDQAPWPLEPDGVGASLQKIDPDSYGNDPIHWMAGFPVDGSPGESSVLAPRRWLMQFGWTNDFPAVEREDPDGDGNLTWEEYVAGTHPLNPGSRLTLTIRPNGTRASYDLSWSSVVGHCYTLYMAADLGMPAIPVPEAVDLPGTGGILQTTVVVPDRSPRWFNLEVEVEHDALP